MEKSYSTQNIELKFIHFNLINFFPYAPAPASHTPVTLSHGPRTTQNESK